MYIYFFKQKLYFPFCVFKLPVPYWKNNTDVRKCSEKELFSLIWQYQPSQFEK